MGRFSQEYQKQLEECGVQFSGKIAVSCLRRMTAGSGSRLWNCPLQLIQNSKKYRVTEQDVTACIEKEAADYEILLAHNPVYFDAY